MAKMTDLTMPYSKQLLIKKQQSANKQQHYLENLIRKRRRPYFIGVLQKISLEILQLMYYVQWKTLNSLQYNCASMKIKIIRELINLRKIEETLMIRLILEMMILNIKKWRWNMKISLQI